MKLWQQFKSWARNHQAMAAGILVGIAALLTSGVVYAVTTSNAHNRGVIVFVGDSNETLASESIDWALTWQSHNNNGYAPMLLSRVGSAIRTEDCLDPTNCTTYNYWQIKLGEVLPKVNADAFVNDLGINDTASAGTATTPGYSYYGQKIDWFMKLIPAGKTVFWTNLPCQIEPSSRLTGCKTVNYALGVARNRWPNLILVDWASLANAHPEYIDPNSTGGVHYTAAGDNAWANLVVSYLDQHFPVPSN